jgi:hypothetical protein
MLKPLDKGFPEGRKERANASVSLAARLLVLVSMMVSAGKWEGLKKTSWGVVTNGMFMLGSATAGPTMIVKAMATRIMQANTDLIPFTHHYCRYYSAWV